MATRRAKRGVPDERPPLPKPKRGRAAAAVAGPRLFVRADDERQLQVLPRQAGDATVTQLQTAVEGCVPRALSAQRFRRFWKHL
jgi:hypothetical protein